MASDDARDSESAATLPRAARTGCPHEYVAGIRRADPSDLQQLGEIDRQADSLFDAVGMHLPDIPFVADVQHESEVVFVVGLPPVAFVQIEVVDGMAHIEGLAVLPEQMRQGIGSALLEAACAWARSAGYPAITLTTYADVTWNAPFYAARGFVEITELTPKLAQVRARERDAGLDALGRRVAMSRDLEARDLEARDR